MRQDELIEVAILRLENDREFRLNINCILIIITSIKIMCLINKSFLSLTI